MTHMRKILAVVVGLVLITIAVLTSRSLKEFTMSAESKINAAVPPSEKLRLAKTAVFETASAAQWQAIETALEIRMKIRALHCAKGYAPPFYIRVKTVRKNLTDTACFHEADNAMAQWLSLRRVGVMLGKPALTPVPTLIPPYIVADAPVQNLTFAENAGIALLETPSTLQIINIETQQPLLREMKGASVPGSLSPNGRLFVTGENTRLSIRDAESGSIVAELNDVALKTFHWLDNTSALYNKSGTEKTFIMDFVAGKALPVQAINQKLLHVARLGQTTNQFAAFSSNSVTKIELVRTQAGLEVKLRDEKQDLPFAIKANASGVSSDGHYVFTLGRELHVLSLGTLTFHSMPMEAFHARQAVATADPDKILLIAPPASAEKGKGNSWLYSISQRTVTAFPSIRTTAARYQYANALRRQVMITENKIALADPFSDARVDAARIPGNRDTSAASIATSLRPQTQAPKAKPGQDEEKNADKTSSITTSGPTTAETKQPDTSPPPPKPGASLPKKSSAPAVAPTPEARPDKKPSLGTTSFQKENDKPNTSTTLKRKMDLSVTT